MKNAIENTAVETAIEEVAIADIQKTATANIQAHLRDLRDTTRKQGRIVAALGVELSKLISTWDASARSYDAARAALEDIVKGIVAKHEDGTPDKDETRALMGSAANAVKIAVLLCTDGSGFVAGYARKDGQQELVTQEELDNMPKQHHANFAPEVFCDFSQTIPKEKNGKNAPKPRASGYLEVATLDKVEAGHKRHVLKKALNAEKTGFATDPKLDKTQPALDAGSSNKQVWQVLDNVKNWLATDSLQAFDIAETKGKMKEEGRTLARLTALAKAIDDAIERNAVVLKEAEQAEAREQDAKMAKAS